MELRKRKDGDYGSMLVIVDDLVLYVLITVSLTLFGILGIVTIILTRAPKQIWAIIKAWLFAKVLTIEYTLTRGYKFVPRKPGPEGSLVAKIDGKKSVKFIASNPDPSLAAPCHLDGSGVKAVLCFEPSTVAVMPTTAAAIQIADSPEKVDELPPHVKAWAESVSIDGKRLLEMRKLKPQGEEVEEPERLLPIDLSRVTKAFANNPSENAYQNQLENEWIDGNNNRRTGMGGFNMKFLAVAAVLVIAAVVVIFLIQGGVIK